MISFPCVVFAVLSNVPVSCDSAIAPLTVGRSCCDSAIVDNLKVQAGGASFGFVIGNSDGPCCFIDEGLSPYKVVHIWSASKWVTGYIILRLVDQGKLTLDTRVADVLDWWTTDSSDERSGVTVRHLLSQTDGMSQFKVGGLIPSWGVEFIGMCPAWDTVGCAQHAHTHLFQSTPGEKFKYSETSFYVLGAIAMKITGHSEYDGVFQELIAGPLNMTGCEFNRAVLTVAKRKADPGGGMACSINEYSKFLRAVFARELVSSEMHEEAEKIQTLSASNMPEESIWAGGEGKQHYSLAHWIQQFDDDAVLMHSMGADGFFPWVWRQGRRSHWGIVAPSPGLSIGGRSIPNGVGITQSSDIFRNVAPLVRLVMQEFNPTTTTTTMPITTSLDPQTSWLLSGSYSTRAIQVVTTFIVVASLLLLD